MLTKPQHGWSTITIGHWSDRCSYLDDVPYLLTQAVDASCRTHMPQSVEFDAEGHEYIIVIGDYHTHIIVSNDDAHSYYTVDVSNKELCRQLIDDIRENIDGWAAWPSHIACRPAMYEDEIRERKLDLSVYCDVMERRHLKGERQNA